jgi:molybdopterin/thiamine biosynthesis adenylyltransferase
MPVLDALARDRAIDRVTLIEPDIFKAHNVERHLFAPSDVGKLKAELACAWLRERRQELEVRVLLADLLDPALQHDLADIAASCDIGVCAADNERAKFHFDSLMRHAKKPWTLGEVLAGGIGGFVHRFVPGGPCYGCVATHLRRDLPPDEEKPPDYSQPGGAIEEATVPASLASIRAIAGLHAVLTLNLLHHPENAAQFTTLLLPMDLVPGLFDEPFRPIRMQIARSSECLICRESLPAAENLDVALDQALARLG